MRLPIESNSIQFAAAGPADSDLDVATKAAKTDINGVPLFNAPWYSRGLDVEFSGP